MDSLPVKPRDVCPHCGYVSDCHTAVGKVPAVPHNGDFSFCIDCGQWGIFETNGQRLPDARETADIANNPLCRKMHEAWQDTMRARTKGKKQ
jgi:hypothetical protein